MFGDVQARPPTRKCAFVSLTNSNSYAVICMATSRSTRRAVRSATIFFRGLGGRGVGWDPYNYHAWGRFKSRRRKVPLPPVRGRLGALPAGGHCKHTL